MKTHFSIIGSAILIAFTLIYGCSGSQDNSPSEGLKPESPASENSNDPMKNKGVGPVKSVTLGPIDQAMVAEGQKIFQEKCSACHKPTEKFVGPAPKGILDRRSPEWIMNMILSPDKMVKEDPVAKQLLMDYNLAPMANQNLTEEQARKILEYFRTL